MPRGANFQKPYPLEFRREAVALYRSSGRSLREIAHDLGISSESRGSGSSRPRSTPAMRAA
jgi:transposase-like protein